LLELDEVREPQRQRFLGRELAPARERGGRAAGMGEVEHGRERAAGLLDALAPQRDASRGERLGDQER